MNKHLEERRNRYFELSTRFASFSDRELLSHLENLPHTTGWARNQVMTVDRKRVFVKRIPVTDKEMDNVHSTRNLYRLPTYYNYGVGSAGFGVFRELFSHVKTTNWVIEGLIENFPLMYHHRLVPYSRRPRTVSDAQQERYIKYWNGSKRVGQYMLDRSRANFEVLVFLEHFPNTLAPWLRTHEDRISRLLDQMHNTVDFLQLNKVIHFDVHARNMLTDGKKAYLADFGLVLDMEFDLDEKERLFFRENKYYDEGVLLYQLASHLANRFMGLSAPKRVALLKRYRVNLDEYASLPARRQLAISLVANIEDIVANGFIKLDENYVELTVKCRPIINLMGEFFTKMRAGSRKNYVFEHSKLKRLLRQVR